MIVFMLYGCQPTLESYEQTVGVPSKFLEEEDPDFIEHRDTADEELLEYPELLMEESDGYAAWQEAAEETGWSYLMACHVCDATIECGNPMNHTVRIAGSDDGQNWEFLSEFPEVEGSVPDILYRDGTLYLYAMHFLYRYDFEDGSWSEPVVVSVEQEDGTMDRHVDPNPLLTDDGRIVLLYLNNDQNGDPASCVEFPCLKSFKMAVEKSDSDGAAFERSQELITVELSQQQRIAADPDLWGMLTIQSG